MAFFGCGAPAQGGPDASGIMVSETALPELTPLQQLDLEIMTVLNTNSKCTATCVGSLTQTQILDRLQVNYPGSDWDLLLLQRRLKVGMAQGRFCRQSISTYGMRTDMAIINSANSIFIPFFKNIKQTPFPITTAASVNFVFKGNSPCFGWCSGLLSR